MFLLATCQLYEVYPKKKIAGLPLSLSARPDQTDPGPKKKKSSINPEAWELPSPLRVPQTASPCCGEWPFWIFGLKVCTATSLASLVPSALAEAQVQRLFALPLLLDRGRMPGLHLQSHGGLQSSALYCSTAVSDSAVSGCLVACGACRPAGCHFISTSLFLCRVYCFNLFDYLLCL